MDLKCLAVIVLILKGKTLHEQNSVLTIGSDERGKIRVLLNRNTQYNRGENCAKEDLQVIKFILFSPRVCKFFIF